MKCSECGREMEGGEYDLGYFTCKCGNAIYNDGSYREEEKKITVVDAINEFIHDVKNYVRSHDKTS